MTSRCGRSPGPQATTHLRDLTNNETRSIQRRPYPAAPNATVEANDDPGLIPLDPATTRQILVTLRGLPRPVLEGFTKAFRKRFQVQEEAASIADRILQKQHQD